MDFYSNRRSSVSSASKMPPRKPPRRSTISTFSLSPSKEDTRSERKPIMRTPSQLYRYVKPPERRNASPSRLQIKGPEFIVRSKDKPCIINLCEQTTKKESMSRKLTIILLSGQQIEVICDPSRTTINHVLKAVTQHQHYFNVIHLLGLALLIKGEFHFLPPKIKLAKIAPKGWKDSKHTKDLFPVDNFSLFLQFLCYPDLERSSGLDEETLNLIYLQLRHDFLEGRVLLPESLLLSLAALALQAEFGNYCSKQNYYFLVEHFLPQSYIEDSLRSSEELLHHLQTLHQSIQISPLRAKMAFVSRLRDTICYGMRLYHCYLTNSERKIWLAVSFKGIRILDKPPSCEALMSALFIPWKDVEKCSRTSLKINISLKTNGKIVKHPFSVSERSLYVLHLIEMHKYFHKKRFELLNVTTTKKPSSLLSTHFSYSLSQLQTVYESIDSQHKDNSLVNGALDADSEQKDSNESFETQEISNKDVMHHLSSNFSEMCLLNNEEHISLKEKRTSFSFPDSGMSSHSKVQSFSNFSPSKSLPSDDCACLLKDISVNSKGASIFGSPEVNPSSCNCNKGGNTCDSCKSSSVDYVHPNAKKVPRTLPCEDTPDLNVSKDKEFNKVYCGDSENESSTSNRVAFPNLILMAKDSKMSDLGSCRSSPSPDSDLSCHSVLNCSNSTERSPFSSPKKAFTGVKMGTRVTSARLQKHKFRLMEVPLDANKSELNSSFSIAVLEPSDGDQSQLDNSVSDSLLTRFLGGSEDALERRLVNVTLTKESGSLGLLLAQGSDGALYIMGISPGGPACKQGTLTSGDRLVGIDGLSVENVSYTRAVSLLKGPSEQVILLVSQIIQEPPPPKSGEDSHASKTSNRKTVRTPSIDPSHVTVITVGPDDGKKTNQKGTPEKSPS